MTTWLPPIRASNGQYTGRPVATVNPHCSGVPANGVPSGAMISHNLGWLDRRVTSQNQSSRTVGVFIYPFVGMVGYDRYDPAIVTTINHHAA